MKRLFILNPKAAKGKAARRLSDLRNEVQRQYGVFDFIIPDGSKETENETRRALEMGYTQLVCLGGDGTLNAVVNGYFKEDSIINPEASIVVAPWGTGSDYFKTLTRSQKNWDWKSALNGERQVTVDVGKTVYLGSDTASRYFVNIASTGLSARVVAEKEKLPKLIPGPLAYLIPVLANVFSFPPVSLELTSNGSQHRKNCLAVFIAKGTFAGGGMRLGGNVSLHDGKFAITVVEEMSQKERLSRLHKIYTGSFGDDSKFFCFTTDEITMRSADKLAIEFDGEIHGTTDVVFSVRPKCLLLSLPPERI